MSGKGLEKKVWKFVVTIV